MTAGISPAELSSVGLSEGLVTQYKTGEACSFWFVRAECVLAAGSGVTPRPIPKLQLIRVMNPSWLRQVEISFADGIAGRYRDKVDIVHDVLICDRDICTTFDRIPSASAHI